LIKKLSPDLRRHVLAQEAGAPSISTMTQERLSCSARRCRGSSKATRQRRPRSVLGEEVPRAGAVVTLSYQRTRKMDGAAVTWLGARKETGRGEGSSGLRFDRLVPTKRRPSGIACPVSPDSSS
jgi:hypothetical protein